MQLRDLQTGQVLHKLCHREGMQAVAWQPEGSLLATGCEDRRIRLWDGAAGQQRGTLEGHRWDVHDLAFDPSGGWLLSFGWDMARCAWDVGFGRQVLKLEDVRILNFGSQGVMKAACLTGGRVRVWGFHPSDVHQVLHGHQKRIVSADRRRGLRKPLAPERFHGPPPGSRVGHRGSGATPPRAPRHGGTVAR